MLVLLAVAGAVALVGLAWWAARGPRHGHATSDGGNASSTTDGGSSSDCADTGSDGGGCDGGGGGD
jgi:hypothetical protein